jgi:hypothetical protein
MDKIVAQGFNRILGFRDVGSGEYSLGKEDQPTPGIRRGTELYDSTVDNLKKPGIVVMYHIIRKRTLSTSFQAAMSATLPMYDQITSHPVV